MEDIDQLIKDTLSKEETAFYDSLEEQNLLDMVVGLFKGKNAWILIATNIMTVVFFALFVYSCIKFLNVDTIEEITKWGLASIMFLLNLSVLKIFAWMQMDKKAILREMKRLELLVVSTADKV